MLVGNARQYINLMYGQENDMRKSTNLSSYRREKSTMLYEIIIKKIECKYREGFPHYTFPAVTNVMNVRYFFEAVQNRKRNANQKT
jgi:hypothetical protein